MQWKDCAKKQKENGGHSNEIWRAIVPNADVKVLYGKNLTNENIDKILKEAAENKNTVLTFSLGGSGHGHSALCAGGRIFSFNGPPHGFAAVKISEDKISFADPHNSKDLKTMSIKQFKKLNPSAVFSINL